ncbi:uncharacterized protein LOC114336155 [Diabrotica virgifera virgifera]|uniref:Uncharacterized protein LOC114336155 n=1 Tax=Diabrotica virgifera virgifera TaxID=50390 RepID=A0A6P7GBS8_DIAVI|nr:uncharacterized protein LOC114336155 [Diabrotica virgifera virgifera]
MKSVFVIVFFACFGIILSAKLPTPAPSPTPEPDDLVCGVCFMIGNIMEAFKKEDIPKETATSQKTFVCEVVFATEETRQLCLDSYLEEVDSFYDEVDTDTVMDKCIQLKKCPASGSY